MFREFFAAGPSHQLLFAWLGLAVFCLHALFNAWLKYALNKWYGTFYDTLQDVDPGSGGFDHLADQRQAVWDQLVEFAWIVAPAVIVHPLGKWVSSWWRFSWRMTLVKAYLLHYDVTMEPMEGSAQRIQEDTSRFENSIYSCVTVALDSVLTLGIFIPVLLGAGAKAHPKGWDSPAWLVIIAAQAAFGGLLVSVFVGRKLVVLEVENQKAEAAFRTKLVMLEQSPVTVVGVEAQATKPSDDVAPDGDYRDIPIDLPTPRPVSPAASFTFQIDALWKNYKNLFTNFAYFNIWIGFYTQAMTILPYVLVAPMLFADDPIDRITLGTLMQVTNAFDKAFGSFAVLTENWPEINNFRSTVRRLREFESQLYGHKTYNKTLLNDHALAPHEIALADLAEDESSSTRRRRVVVDEY